VNYGGWAVQYNYDTRKIHVIPIDDLRAHEEVDDCWCKPHVDEQGVCVHHAMDGRVEYETDERRPS
jgi:hypothetical protein